MSHMQQMLSNSKVHRQLYGERLRQLSTCTGTTLVWTFSIQQVIDLHFIVLLSATSMGNHVRACQPICLSSACMPATPPQGLQLVHDMRVMLHLANPSLLSNQHCNAVAKLTKNFFMQTNLGRWKSCSAIFIQMKHGHIQRWAFVSTKMTIIKVLLKTSPACKTTCGLHNASSFAVQAI